MPSADPLAFASYVNDLAYTILIFFKQPTPPDKLMEWLRPMVSDEDNRALLMHEEPLYVAADFLGIDRLAPEFRATEEKYQVFRASVLYPSRSPAPVRHRPPRG